MIMQHYIYCTFPVGTRNVFTCPVHFQDQGHVICTHGIPPIQCIRNVKEISCVLGTGNAHEIVPYTDCIRKFPGNVQISCSKNVYTMNRKCDLSYTFLGISQPRKFKISSSATHANLNFFILQCLINKSL